MAEVLIVVATLVVLLSLAVPAVADVADASRARHAAGIIAGRFREARLAAATQGVNVAVVFDFEADRWSLRVCRDGNGNGVKRADIQDGRDPCVDGPHDLRTLLAGVDVAVDPDLPGPGGEPGSPDPVRFGAADLLSCSPPGSCTAGTLFLRSGQGAHYAVRVAGVTGRTRILRHEATGWREP